MAEEKPTLDEQVPEATDAGATEQKVDLDGIVSLLESAGVNSAEDLQGKLNASREAGNLAFQLGEARRQIEKLQKMGEQPKKVDFDPYESNNPIDLENALEGAVEKVLTKRERAQQEMQERQMQTWSKIQSHPYYAKIKDIFREKMQDPEMVTKLQTGKTNVETEFYNTVIDFQSGVIKKAHGTLVTLKGEGGTETVATPQVETSQARVSAQTPEAKADKEKKIDGFKEKVDSGKLLSETEEMAALDAILGP